MTITVWAVGVIVFCIGCYLGTQTGIARRVPTYAPLQDMLETANIDLSDLRALDLARLHWLHWDMQGEGRPQESFQQILVQVIRPAMRDRERAEGFNRVDGYPADHWFGAHRALEEAIDHLIGAALTQQQTVTRSARPDEPPPLPDPAPVGSAT